MIPLQLHDSMRRKTVPFEPLVPGKVGMYVCGPTTYTEAHIGHAYSAISFDTIRRGLTFLGYEVNFVRNVTDVDDKIIKRANEIDVDPMELSAKFAADYNRDMARFNVLPPSVEPKVSTHIAEIIALIERLILGKHAYEIDGSVYYEVRTFPPYGKLSEQDIDKLRAGERIAVDERKRDPADFALWKAAKPGEPSWESPWGKGRPGWHIECSAMTVTHLGPTFDIHGGGKDLIFPHHENEIAQSQGDTGEGTFARYWLHNGFLNFDGEKMARSVGNVMGCGHIAEAVGGEALRFFCVSHHYRSPVEFEIEKIKDKDGNVTEVRFRSLESADRRLAYFYETLAKIDAQGEPGDGPVKPDADKLLPAAREALADDFNSPVVVAALGEAAKVANKLLDETKGVDKQLRKRTLHKLGVDLRAVGQAIGVLGANPADYLAERRARLIKREKVDAPRIDGLIADRKAARQAKDFAKADEIRDELTRLRIAVFDSPTGTVWNVRDDEGQD